jgi:hypothetical protein
MPTSKRRYYVTLSDAEHAAFNSWRRAQGITGFAEAIRTAMRKAAPGMPNETRHGDYTGANFQKGKGERD